MARSHKGLFAVAALLAAFSLAACSAKSTSTAATVQAGATTTTTAASGPAPLTGIGATVAQMVAAHGKGNKCAVANACFGSSVHNATAANTFQFAPVSISDGIVDGYDQNFTDGTALATAERLVLQWMPKDAVAGPLVIDHNGGSCGMLNITSSTLGQVFAGPNFNDPQGVIGVELSYINANLVTTYDPTNIQDATLATTPIDPTGAC